MELLRKEAIILLSFFELFHLSSEELAIKTDNVKAENSFDELDEAPLNSHIRKYIENELASYTNAYLQSKLFNILNSDVKIIGNDPKLFPCVCCGYNTLGKRGEYLICNVCFWEDDGENALHVYSAPNHMTLAQAKNNFKEHQVISKHFSKNLHPERMMQFKNLFSV
jgi:hypothetical protein